MNEKGRWTNPEILRWARTRLNLSPEDVVEESKKLSKHFTPIRLESLLAWEAGKALPDMAELETLSEIYLCPVGYFFLDSVPHEELPLSFRGLAKPEKSLSPLTQRTVRRFLELAQWTLATLKETGQRFEVKIRPDEATPRTSDPEDLAKELRERFGWTAEQRKMLKGNAQAAYGWWRRKVEECGVFCFEMALDSKDARGASMWLQDYPFILVNHSDIESATGRIFTLLHEFAHLISAKHGVVCDFEGTDPSAETFANRLAAGILVTREEIVACLRQLGEYAYREDWPDTLLDKVKRRFYTSRDVVLIRLEELGLAPSEAYRKKKQEWEARLEAQTAAKRRGGRLHQNEEKLQEIGYSLTRLLARTSAMSSERGFSWLDVSLMLGMKVEKTEAFLRWAQSSLA
jgi:Zn-dependent peptidase ImmA (M78 family)/transcriptional regulator with XRE-family HTH domain